MEERRREWRRGGGSGGEKEGRKRERTIFCDVCAGKQEAEDPAFKVFLRTEEAPGDSEKRQVREGRGKERPWGDSRSM